MVKFVDYILTGVKQPPKLQSTYISVASTDILNYSTGKVPNWN